MGDVTSPSIDKKSSFRRNRVVRAQELLIEYDRTAFGGLLLLPQQQLSSLSSPTGGSDDSESPSPNVTIRWSNRLRTTAGRAHLILHSQKNWRKKSSRKDHIHQMEIQEHELPKSFKDGKSTSTDPTTETNVLQASQNTSSVEVRSQGVRRTAIVELSTKVVDDELRLQTTLLHELCHVAAWIIDGNLKPPHGPYFKKWVTIVTSTIKPTIPITTKHKFEIHFKYSWECANPSCSVTFIRRHSRRSIDTKRHVCGKCRGPLREVVLQQQQPSTACNVNVQNDATPKRPPTTPRTLTEYHRFIQTNSKMVEKQLLLRQQQLKRRKQTGKVSPQTVMKECAKLWQQYKRRK